MLKEVVCHEECQHGTLVCSVTEREDLRERVCFGKIDIGPGSSSVGVLRLCSIC